jgi:hypothetical protein
VVKVESYFAIAIPKKKTHDKFVWYIFWPFLRRLIWRHLLKDGRRRKKIPFASGPLSFAPRPSNLNCLGSLQLFCCLHARIRAKDKTINRFGQGGHFYSIGWFWTDDFLTIYATSSNDATHSQQQTKEKRSQKIGAAILLSGIR